MPFRRAHHSKSRLGCYNCKSRRVKCDETRPVCLRCAGSGRTCTPDSSRPRQHPGCKQFKSVIFAGPASSIIIDEDSLMSLEYFHALTLPLCDVSEPSLLWRCVARDVGSDQTTCYIAAAIGHRHMHMAQEHMQRYAESSHRLHARALRAVRKSLSSACPTTPVHYSLLLAILQGLHQDQAGMHVHLRHGVQIASQQHVAHARGGGSAAPAPLELRESLRLLRKYSTFGALFDSVGKDANLTAAMVTTEGEQVGHVDEIPRSSSLQEDDLLLLAELDTLNRQLLQTMRCSRTPRYDGAGNATLEAFPSAKAGTAAAALELKANQTALQAAIEARLICAEKGAASSSMAAQLHFAFAQCLLAGIFLRCCQTGAGPCAFDAEYPTFSQMIDVVTAGLALLPKLTSSSNSNSNLKQGAQNAMPFSLGLGAIGSLVYVALLCRDGSIRREAVRTLALCPSAENLWTVEMAQRVCATVVSFEEKLAAEACDELAYKTTRYIPWHCRVQYHHFRNTEQQQQQAGSILLRLFRSADSNGSAFIYNDVQAVDLETALYFMKQPIPT